MQEFNRGVYDYVVATDGATVISPSSEAVAQYVKGNMGGGGEGE